MNIKNKYMKMLKFRHATRTFKENIVISNEDLTYILEAGCLSPSSFGIEPWEFLVAISKDAKNNIQKASFSQSQVGSASAVIVILARKDLYIEDGYVESLLRRDGDEFFEDIGKKSYTDYTSSLSKEGISAYADKQCYLASMNLMNAAAILGIDSCPIGGFEADKIIDLFNIDSSKYEVSLVIAFGYRVSEPNIKNRRDFDDIVKFVDSI